MTYFGFNNFKAKGQKKPLAKRVPVGRLHNGLKSPETILGKIMKAQYERDLPSRESAEKV